MLMLSFVLASLQSRLQSDRGATAVEYGLLIAGIAVLIIAAAAVFGPAVAKVFTDTAAKL